MEHKYKKCKFTFGYFEDVQSVTQLGALINWNLYKQKKMPFVDIS